MPNAGDHNQTSGARSKYTSRRQISRPKWYWMPFTPTYAIEGCIARGLVLVELRSNSASAHRHDPPPASTRSFS